MAEQPIATAQAPGREAPLRWFSWRHAAGGAGLAAAALMVTGAFLPWVSTFAGLISIPGVRGSNGRLLAAGGAVIALAGLAHLIGGGRWSRWLIGYAGFAATAFSGFLLLQLAASMQSLSTDSMVAARSGPGLWVTAAGSALAFATLFFPSSAQRGLVRRDAHGGVLAWAADRESTGWRRGLQISLGVVWLADGALQLQPFMFGRGFVNQILMPAYMGSPGWGHRPGDGLHPARPARPGRLERRVRRHPAADRRCAVVAADRHGRRWPRASRGRWPCGGSARGWAACSAARPARSPARPGRSSCTRYWPCWPGPRRLADRPPGPSPRAARWAAAEPGPRGWHCGAVPATSSCRRRTGRPVPCTTRSRAWRPGNRAGSPAMDRAVASTAGGHGTVISIAFAVIFVAVGLGVFWAATTRAALVLSVITALAIWVFGENFGAILSGHGTDPNSGLLLVLLAAAFWPLRRQPAPAVSGDHGQVPATSVEEMA